MSDAIDTSELVVELMPLGKKHNTLVEGSHRKLLEITGDIYLYQPNFIKCI